MQQQYLIFVPIQLFTSTFNFHMYIYLQLRNQEYIHIIQTSKMIPYRQPQAPITTQPSRQSKQPSIPSLELVHTLSTLCQLSQGNSYDAKNHLLTINDLNSFESAIHHKYGRSFRLFEKQLKILGWRLRMYKAEGNGEKDDVRVYKWKGKKQLLIDEELNVIDTGLKQRKIELQQTRAHIRQIRKSLDTKLQSLLFSFILKTNPQKSKTQLQQLLKQTKTGVNNTELALNKIINKMSITLGNQLQLYKLLIYKEGVCDKKMQGQLRQEQGEQWGEQGEVQGEGGRNQESENNGVIQEQQYGERNSLVSIQVEAQAKKEEEEEEEEEQRKQEEGNGIKVQSDI